MQSREVNGITYLLPETVADVQTLVTQARQQKKQIRVRGAYHSVAAAVDPTTSAEAANGIYVLLSYLNKVSINSTTQSVTVEAGCHLGYDPLDPTGISTWENSLFAQIDQAGFAVPDMGGIIHQTVGGFLSTGSAGGSTQYSFNESLVSLTFIPANADNPQPVTVSINDADTDLFFAAGVSLGLLGIIVSATFSLIPKYNITGTETITTIANSGVDMTGTGIAGKQSLKDFLTQTEYARLLWYPQPGVSKVTVWQASKIAPVTPFTPKPYEEFPQLFHSQLLPQVGADLVYSAIGKWPNWLGDAIGTNNPMYQAITGYVDKNFYPQILPDILDVFVAEDPKDANGQFKPQEFHDYWYSSLPMDNQVNDRLFPVEFTELWIPFDPANPTDRIAEVLQEMNNLFKTMYANNSGPMPGGAFSVELYAGKKSNFWMSPAYNTDVFRVDVFWFGNNIGSPADTYYPMYWEALSKFDYRCHWGKYLPPADGAQGAAYLQQQYPQWEKFMAFRQQYDPEQVFVSDYWRQHLNISSL